MPTTTKLSLILSCEGQGDVPHSKVVLVRLKDFHEAVKDLLVIAVHRLLVELAVLTWASFRDLYEFADYYSQRAWLGDGKWNATDAVEDHGGESNFSTHPLCQLTLEDLEAPCAPLPENEDWTDWSPVLHS